MNSDFYGLQPKHKSRADGADRADEKDFSEADTLERGDGKARKGEDCKPEPRGADRALPDTALSGGSAERRRR